MLSLEKDKVAKVFYRRHRIHIFRVVARMVLFLAISGVLAGISLLDFFRGKSDTTQNGIAAAAFGAVFIFLCWTTYRSVCNLFQVRVLPYFERPVGQHDTWRSGENYLRHSKKLDEIAARLGVQPLSKFASGDDMIWGESLNWFSPEDALQTLERLLQTDVSNALPSAVVSDLTHIRDSLRLASSKSLKFCLLIREGTSASGMEMERRKGSFF